MASPGMPGAVQVQMALGTWPDNTAPSSWTDITEWVLMTPGVTITPGRTAERSSIAPRRCEFTLDNSDGRFNPRNASGPYYGLLTPRVPVRVRVHYSSVDYSLFRGFVDGGFPQDFTAGGMARTVPITALDAVGWAATAPPPRSAWEGEVAALRDVDDVVPVGWLRPRSDGTWIDLITGYEFSHSASFAVADPFVDGDEEGGLFCDTPGGRAVDASANLNAPEFASGSGGLVVWWQSVTAKTTGASIIFDISRGTSRVNATLARTAGISTSALAVGAWNGATGDYTRVNRSVLGLSAIDHFGRGQPIMVAFAKSADGSGRVWINGEEQTVTYYGGLPSSSHDWCFINETPDPPIDPYSAQQDPWVGHLDHIMWWTDASSWGVTADEVVARLFDAARVARAGDSMSDRMAWLLDASGWSLVGTLDDSQIVTQQGYRRADTVLELLQRLEDTEQGRVWVDNGGRFCFSARSWPTADAVSNTVQATFGDSGSDLPYSAELSRIVDDDRQVVNVAQVTREYGTQQQAENADSIAAYGRRQPVHLSGLMFANDRQSKQVADWIVSTHAEPQARVEVLTFHPVNTPGTLAPFAGLVEPGWLVRVKRDGLTFDGHVVDVGHHIGTTWTVSLHLDATRAGDLTGFTWDDGTGTVGTPWDDGTGTTSGAKGWVF